VSDESPGRGNTEYEMPSGVTCDSCDDPDAIHVLGSEHNTLCDDCLELEKAGLGHLEVLRIVKCSRCGAAEGATDGIKGVHRLHGNFCTECVFEMVDRSERGDAR